MRAQHFLAKRSSGDKLVLNKKEAVAWLSIVYRMSKEYWEQVCNAAISRPLRDATNAWGAVVVSCDAHLRAAAPRCH